jgi:hypothetical protein
MRILLVEFVENVEITSNFSHISLKTILGVTVAR